MRVAEIIFMTTKKAKVLFDKEPSLVLYKGEIRKLHWEEETEVSPEEYERVRRDIVEKRAKLYAMRLLQDQDRTEKEITDKIRRAGYDTATAQAALDYVKGFGYVDDERYASNYIDHYRGLKSHRQIRQDLTKKGIASETVASMLADQTEESDEYSAIVRLLKKRHYVPVSDEDSSYPYDERADGDRNDRYKQAQKERDRQLRYLASKGFSYSAVRFVFDHWDELA